MPTTEAECRELLEWAQSTPVASAPAASTEQIARHLQFMAATLPAKGVSAETGAMRSTVYTSLLAGYSNDALAYMARRACQTLDWFPTPKQCLALLADYQAPEPPQSVALRLCHDFAAASFERWMQNVRDGQSIGDVPDQWKRIAVEQGILRRLDSGEFVTRERFRELHPPIDASGTEAREGGDDAGGSVHDGPVPQADDQQAAA